MLTEEQWQRIRMATDAVVDRQSNLNAICDETSFGLPVEIYRGRPDEDFQPAEGDVVIWLKPDTNWNLEPS